MIALLLATDDELPPLAPHSAFLIVGIILLFWVHTRVSIIRRHLERSGPDAAPPPRAWGWLQFLAAQDWFGPVVFLAAGSLGAALVLTWPA